MSYDRHLSEWWEFQTVAAIFRSTQCVPSCMLYIVSREPAVILVVVCSCFVLISLVDKAEATNRAFSKVDRREKLTENGEHLFKFDEKMSKFVLKFG